MFLNIPALKSIYSGILIILLGQNLDRVTLVFLLGLSTLSVPTPPRVPAPPQALTLAPKSCDDNYCARKSPQPLVWETLWLVVKSCSAQEKTCTTLTLGLLEPGNLRFRPLCKWTQAYRSFPIRDHLSRDKAPPFLSQQHLPTNLLLSGWDSHHF